MNIEPTIFLFSSGDNNTAPIPATIWATISQVYRSSNVRVILAATLAAATSRCFALTERRRARAPSSDLSGAYTIYLIRGVSLAVSDIVVDAVKEVARDIY